MERKTVIRWLNNLKKYWFNKDVINAVKLFEKTVYYQETPFMKPYYTQKEIEQEWQHVLVEDIKQIDFKLLAFDFPVAIVEWTLEQNNDFYSGIYEIKFNEEGSCISFRSWEMVKEC